MVFDGDYVSSTSTTSVENGLNAGAHPRIKPTS
jgi:hypothetical protein